MAVCTNCHVIGLICWRIVPTRLRKLEIEYISKAPLKYEEENLPVWSCISNPSLNHEAISLRKLPFGHSTYPCQMDVPHQERHHLPQLQLLLPTHIRGSASNVLRLARHLLPIHLFGGGRGNRRYYRDCLGGGDRRIQLLRASRMSVLRTE